MFRLTKEELQQCSRFQFETLKGRGNNIKYLPYAFTEQGVAMLATVIRTSVAEEVSIAIMDAFVEMRRFINNNREIFTRVISLENDLHLLNEKQGANEEKFELIFNELGKKEFKEQLFFDGQIYDAYSLLVNIIREAKTKIIIIDNYLDKTILDILAYKDDNIFGIHPTSKKQILNFQVPQFEEAKKLVLEAAKEIPEIKYIGWDVAISDKGPCIIEGNSYPGVFQIKPRFNKEKTGILPKYEKIMKINLQ